MVLKIIFGAALVFVIAACVVVALNFSLWIQSTASGAQVSFMHLLMMRLRRVSPQRVVACLIPMMKADVEVSCNDLEVHLLAGGNIEAVADAAISAEKADLDISFSRLAAIDLAGRDVVDAVNTRVSPKVIECPSADSPVDVITGVCRDGIRLAANARITVRTQLDRLVGGAGEETIAARVGEGIVTVFGNAESHQDILENPDAISRYLLDKGLADGTCLEILSVDIADVDVKDNISARLRSEQADADKRIAQATAEIRRAAAVAANQEMLARTTQMDSRVVAAEANVPLALSSSFREANVGNPRALKPSCNGRFRWRMPG